MFKNRHSSRHDACQRRQIGRTILVGGVFDVHTVCVSGRAPVQGGPLERPASGVNPKPAINTEPTHSAVHFVVVTHPRLDCLDMTFGDVAVDVRNHGLAV